MKSSLAQNPDLDLYIPVFCPSVLRLTRIIVFQFWASMLFAYGIMLSDRSTTYLAYSSLIMFLTFVISGQMSGGQGNPIITIALLFMKGSNVTPLNAMVYIVTQFVGAIAGGAIGYGTINTYACAYPLVNAPRTFGGELLGSLFFVILYLIIMSASTKFQNNFWAYITVPCAFFIARMLTYQYLGLNPAAVLANQIFFGAKYQKWDPLNDYWAYIVGPVVGAVVGTIFFNYFLLPIHQKWVSRK